MTKARYQIISSDDSLLLDDLPEALRICASFLEERKPVILNEIVYTNSIQIIEENYLFSYGFL